jgi:CDP-6-deoxy-D-xylo-4-hexulose-3-dehydrase
VGDNVKDNELDKILSLVDSYIRNKQSEKTWTPGEDWVYYAGPYFDSHEYINGISSLLNGWLVLGKEGTTFERRFSGFLGKEKGLLVNSGSSANLLMMAAVASKNLNNLSKGTKVLTPIAGFPTTINPIFQMGFEPVFVDIELPSLNLDIDQAEKALQDHNIKIITFAHVLGNPPNMDRIMKLVKKYDLILLEDCCDALAGTYDGKPLGSFGDMASCSFYPAHHITMGEGGFVAVKDPLQEKVVRSLRDWGRGCYCVGEKASISKTGACGKRFSCWLDSMPDRVFDHKYVYTEIGYNLKPIELQAAIGLAQLDKVDEIKTLRNENFDNLFKIFKKYEQFFHLPVATEKSDPNWFAFPLTIRDGCPFTRSQLTTFLETKKIQTRTYFGGNVMLQPAYSHLANTDDVVEKYPVARKVTTDTFFLGTSPVITKEKINYIERIVDAFMGEIL